MAAVILQKSRVQNAVRDFVNTSVFHRALYSVGTNLLSFDSEQLIIPQSVAMNEMSSSFRHSTRTGSKWKSERNNWTWDLILKFAQEACVEVFEHRWAESPIFLPTDNSSKLAAMRIEIGPVTYLHPPMHQAETGTLVTVTFEAIITQ